MRRLIPAATQEMIISCVPGLGSTSASPARLVQQLASSSTQAGGGQLVLPAAHRRAQATAGTTGYRVAKLVVELRRTPDGLKKLSARITQVRAAKGSGSGLCTIAALRRHKRKRPLHHQAPQQLRGVGFAWKMSKSGQISVFGRHGTTLPLRSTRPTQAADKMACASTRQPVGGDAGPAVLSR